MAFKFVVFAALVGFVYGGVLPAALHPTAYHAALPAYHTGPVAVAPVPVAAKAIDADYDPHPQYSYSYDVHDSLTGDAKNQYESRNGDLVEGSYSLIESDGTRRIVDYTADDINGFNAIVRKEPATVAVKAAVAAPLPAAPLVAAAPAVVKTAPVYAAPSYAQPAYAQPAYAYAQPAYLAHAKIAAPLAPAIAAAPAKIYSAAPAFYH